MDTVERKQKVEEYGRGFALLSETLQNIPKDMWQFKPAPQEWSVHEIIVHLADSETNSYLRARQLVAQPGESIMAYDQDVWAVKLNYHERDWQDALEILRLVRKATYEMLISLPDDVWDNSIKHPEYEDPYTFDMWLDIYAAHIPGHIEQIENNQHIWEEQGKP